jgi:hypothetical protein
MASRALSLTSVALAASTLMSCTGGASKPDGPTPQPSRSTPQPHVLITLRGARQAPKGLLAFRPSAQVAAIGTNCWTKYSGATPLVTSCKDAAGPRKPGSYLEVPSGATIHLDTDATTVTGSVDQVTGNGSSFDVHRVQGLTFVPGYESLTVPKGDYVLELFATWEGEGDATYYFGVRVV